MLRGRRGKEQPPPWGKWVAMLFRKAWRIRLRSNEGRSLPGTLRVPESQRKDAERRVEMKARWGPR